jgi:hypothetical protein
MAHVWQMPVYREPTSLEIMIHNLLGQTQESFEQCINSVINSNDTLAYWWNHPHRRPIFVLSIVLEAITICLVISSIATRKMLRAQAAQLVSQPASQGMKTHTQAPLRKSTRSTESPPETPVPRKPTHTNDFEPSGTPSMGTHLLFNIGKKVDSRTGRVSTPGSQPPFVDRTGRRNFSGLSKTAPVSYCTLQRNGLLDAEGTPTEKFSPATSKGGSDTPVEEEYVRVYDSPTRSWGNVKRSKVLKEAQRRADGV